MVDVLHSPYVFPDVVATYESGTPVKALCITDYGIDYEGEQRWYRLVDLPVADGSLSDGWVNARQFKPLEGRLIKKCGEEESKPLPGHRPVYIMPGDPPVDDTLPQTIEVPVQVADEGPASPNQDGQPVLALDAQSTPHQDDEPMLAQVQPLPEDTEFGYTEGDEQVAYVDDGQGALG